MEHDERAPSQEHQMTMEKKDPYCGQKPFNGHTPARLTAEGWNALNGPVFDLFAIDEPRTYVAQMNRDCPEQKQNVEFFLECWNSYYPDKAEIQSLRERVGVLEAGVHEAALQIEYLHSRFQETGSGNGVLARLRALLSTSEQK